MNHLPLHDQPDNYTGNHYGAAVRWINMEKTGNHYTGHLHPTGQHASRLSHHKHTTPPTGATYCTRLIPGATYDLHGVAYKRSDGTRGYVQHGATLTTFTNELGQATRKGLPVVWCTHCLTMLAVEAEMNTQTAYKVKTVLNQLGKQAGKHTSAPGTQQ